MAVPSACQGIADQITGVEEDRLDLQLQLQQAPTNQKAALASQIKALNRQLVVLNDQLVNCLAQQPQPPPPLAVSFSGTVSLTTTNSSAPGPYQMSINLLAMLNGDRTLIVLTSFPAVATVPTEIPGLGTNVTTVSKIAGGSGSYSAGQITMPITLRFDHSIDVPFYEEDSNLPLVLTTSPPGSPVDGNGFVALSGSGVFAGGFLGGASGTVRLEGAFSPVP